MVKRKSECEHIGEVIIFMIKLPRRSTQGVSSAATDMDMKQNRSWPASIEAGQLRLKLATFDQCRSPMTTPDAIRPQLLFYAVFRLFNYILFNIML